MNSVCVDDFTAKRAIISSNGFSQEMGMAGERVGTWAKMKFDHCVDPLGFSFCVTIDMNFSIISFSEFYEDKFG